MKKFTRAVSLGGGRKRRSIVLRTNTHEAIKVAVTRPLTP